MTAGIDVTTRPIQIRSRRGVDITTPRGVTLQLGGQRSTTVDPTRLLPDPTGATPGQIVAWTGTEATWEDAPAGTAEAGAPTSLIGQDFRRYADGPVVDQVMTNGSGAYDPVLAYPDPWPVIFSPPPGVRYGILDSDFLRTPPDGLGLEPDISTQPARVVDAAFALYRPAFGGFRVGALAAVIAGGFTAGDMAAKRVTFRCGGLTNPGGQFTAPEATVEFHIGFTTATGEELVFLGHHHRTSTVDYTDWTLHDQQRNFDVSSTSNAGDAMQGVFVIENDGAGRYRLFANGELIFDGTYRDAELAAAWQSVVIGIRNDFMDEWDTSPRIEWYDITPWGVPSDGPDAADFRDPDHVAEFTAGTYDVPPLAGHLVMHTDSEAPANRFNLDEFRQLDRTVRFTAAGDAAMDLHVPAADALLTTTGTLTGTTFTVPAGGTATITVVDVDDFGNVTWALDDADEPGAGASGVTGPTSSIDGRPALWDGTGGDKLKVGTVNTANGLVRLDGDGTIPDILHPASIARDTEVTSAIATAVTDLVGTAPAGGDTLGELHARLAIIEALGSLATDAELIAAVAALIGTADTAGDTLGELEALINARLAKTNNLSDLTNTTTARTNLGVAIGTDVQAYSAVLAALAALSPTTFGKSLLELANGAALLTAAGGAASSRTITAGTGLTGGGDLTADRTIAVDFGTTSGKVADGAALAGKVAASTFTAKGDAIFGTGSAAYAKVAAGTDGQVTISDSAQTAGRIAGWARDRMRPIVSGRFYGPTRGGATGTQSFAADFLRCVGYIPPVTHAWDRLAIYTTATVGGKARLGIYDSDGTNSMPMTRLLDGGEVDTSGTAGDRLVTINYTLIAGHLYWLGVNVNVTTTVAHATAPSYDDAPAWGISGGIGSPTNYLFAYAATSYASAPMPATITATEWGNTTPYMLLRAA